MAGAARSGLLRPSRPQGSTIYGRPLMRLLGAGSNADRLTRLAQVTTAKAVEQGAAPCDIVSCIAASKATTVKVGW